MAHIYNSQLDAFELYHQIHDTPNSSSPSSNLASVSGSALPALGHAIAGSVGAAISNVCTYPLDLVITRLQIQQRYQSQRDSDKTTATSHDETEGEKKEEYHSIQDVTVRIYEAEGGIWAFYTGLASDTAKTIADSFLFFLAYNFLRRRRMVAVRGEGANSAASMLPVLDELAVGFAAGSFTKLVTSPISNIVTRKQTSAVRSSSTNSPESDLKAPSTIQIAREILQQRGIAGFWSGYSAALVLTLNPSLTFFLFESLKRLLLPRAKRANPSPSATFILAALSKACASSVTYPFSVAKARVQAGSPGSNSTQAGAINKDQGNPASTPSPSSPSPTIKTITPSFLSTLLSAIHTNGLKSLYSGLSLELTKSFVSHGITMLVKQYVHRLIIQAYYMLGVLALHWRSRGLSTAQTGKLLERARDRRHEYYDLARKRAEERAGQLRAIGAALAQSVTDNAANLVADYVEVDGTESGFDQGLSGLTGLARWLEEK